MQYAAKMNSFMPPATIPFLAWAATADELFFGITLILGDLVSLDRPRKRLTARSVWDRDVHCVWNQVAPWIIRSSLRQAQQSC
jgi:hypothetical protein